MLFVSFLPRPTILAGLDQVAHRIANYWEAET